jgi:hypothetical protein
MRHVPAQACFAIAFHDANALFSGSIAMLFVAQRSPGTDFANRAHAGLTGQAGRQLELLREAIAALPLRPYDRITHVPPSRHVDCLERALSGRPFDLFGHEFRIAPGIDWQAKGAPRSARHAMQSWHMLEPLLSHHTQSGDENAALLAIETALEWIGVYGETVSEWADAQTIRADEESFAPDATAVSRRTYRLAYIVGIAAGDERVGDPDFERLLRCLMVHQNYMAEESHFTGHTNRGVLEAAGQICAGARFLALGGADEAAEIRRVAQRSITQGAERLVELVRNQVDSDGVHLEHSPGYHMMVLETIDWLISSNALQSPWLSAIAQKMRAAAGWMYDTRNRIANFGDTDIEGGYMAPVDCSSTPGLRHKLFPAGYWFVKGDDAAGGTYFAQTAAFHSRTHKHADTCSFVWREGGAEILIDPGKYAYLGRTSPSSDASRDGFWYSDPYRQYVECSRAHNTVTVEGRNHRRVRTKTSGSSLLYAAQHGDLFCSKSEIPNLAGAHGRILVLRPGRWLLCVDSVRMREEQAAEISQHFQIHPDWKLQDADLRRASFLHPDGRVLHAHTLFAGSLIADIAFGRMGDGGASADSLAGWSSRAHQAIEPCTSLRVSNKDVYATLATLFHLGDVEIDSRLLQSQCHAPALPISLGRAAMRRDVNRRSGAQFCRPARARRAA